MVDRPEEAAAQGVEGPRRSDEVVTSAKPCSCSPRRQALGSTVRSARFGGDGRIGRGYRLKACRRRPLRISRIQAERFRGFDHVDVVAGEHVLLVGEPRAGRSDLIAAMRLVLDPAPTRSLAEDDFFRRSLNDPAVIEITIVDLPVALQQRFLDRLELWDEEAQQIVGASDELDERNDTGDLAIRLACRLSWDPDDEEASLIRYWPARSNPAAEQFDRVSRADREALPIEFLTAVRPLNLAPQGAFRRFARLLDDTGVDAALDAMADSTVATAHSLATTPAIATPTGLVLDPLRSLLDLGDDLGDVVRLIPDGGSLAGLLRSLVPAPSLDDSIDHLALARHGSTTESQIATAELVAVARQQGGVVIVDDFGDRLDSSSAERLARLLRAAADQLWLSTRRPESARSFEPRDIIRLTRSKPASPSRSVFYGREPANRAERLAHRELHRQILPAMTSRALIICEGTHDLAAYLTLSEIASRGDDWEPPEAHRSRLINAGSVDQVPALAQLARSLGFRTVAMLDYDNRPESADRLAKALGACDAVVRLPEGHAIERAIGDVADSAIIASLTVLDEHFAMNLPPGWAELADHELRDVLMKALKSNGGLHAQFLRALDGELPGVALTALRRAINAAAGDADGHIQL